MNSKDNFSTSIPPVYHPLLLSRSSLKSPRFFVILAQPLSLGLSLSFLSFPPSFLHKCILSIPTAHVPLHCQLFPSAHCFPLHSQPSVHFLFSYQQIYLSILSVSLFILGSASSLLRFTHLPYYSYQCVPFSSGLNFHSAHFSE